MKQSETREPAPTHRKASATNTTFRDRPDKGGFWRSRGDARMSPSSCDDSVKGPDRGGERKFNAVARNSRIVEDEADVRSPTECAATCVAAHSMSYMVSFLRGASSDWYMEIV
jgi:hypothetical protein